MNFRTKIDISVDNRFEIDHRTNIMMMGSCFSQNIGNKLIESKFAVNESPFGIIYNPLSISSSIRRLISGKLFTADELVYHNDVYQSFMHHGSFSSHNKDECLENINSSYANASSMISSIDTFIITFGTSYVYKLKETDKIVTNCHKFPAREFNRIRLNVEEIYKDWSILISQLLEINPKLKIIFTVSPIRHWRDGAHENTISKSILHLAIDTLQTLYPESVLYFPAYEILIDELRDYRFYDEDMMHPSDLSVEYIWKRFGDSFFSNITKDKNKRINKIIKSINHKPLNINTESYITFLNQTLANIINFQESYPEIDCSRETTILKTRIKQWNTR